MATNSEVRDALADALADLPANVEKYPVDAPTAPAIVVGGYTADPSSFNGGRASTWVIWVLASQSHVDQMQRLDDLLDATGSDTIAEALTTYDNAAGISWGEPTIADVGFKEWAGVIYYGATLTLSVWH